MFWVFKGNRNTDKIKQVIIVRTDLEMGKGKTCAQVAHASVSAYLEVIGKNKDIANRWIETGQKKIVLKVKNEEELIDAYKKARERGIPTVLISDAGYTQIPANTKTTVAIGPWYEEELTKMYGSLKLL